MNSNPLFIEWQRLGDLGKGLIPVRLGMRGQADDIPSVLDDLELIEDRFYKLLGAYRNEVCSSFSEVDRDYFVQVADAMGDAMNALKGHLQDVAQELTQIESEEAA